MEKGLSNNYPNFYNDCADSLDFRGTVSKIMRRTVCIYISVSKLVMWILSISILISNQKFIFSQHWTTLAISCSGAKYHPKFLHNAIFQNYIKANFIMLSHKYSSLCLYFCYMRCRVIWGMNLAFSAFLLKKFLIVILIPISDIDILVFH